MELSTNSQHCLTVNTHKGFYVFHRLTYGIASAPALFQSTMDQISQGMDNVRCHIDDIIIRTDPHEHLRPLQCAEMYPEVLAGTIAAILD